MINLGMSDTKTQIQDENWKSMNTSRNDSTNLINFELIVRNSTHPTRIVQF